MKDFRLGRPPKNFFDEFEFDWEINSKGLKESNNLNHQKYIFKSYIFNEVKNDINKVENSENNNFTAELINFKLTKISKKSKLKDYIRRKGFI